MDKNCTACEYLKDSDPKTEILVTKHWNVAIGNNHAYFGRAFANLRTHKSSLASLSREEWEDFEAVVRRLEQAYKEVFGAEPLNWGCFMNHSFRSEPFNPHVHWHIFPRYKIAPEIDGMVFDDALFGDFYDYTAERLVSDETVGHIASKLTKYLETHE